VSKDKLKKPLLSRCRSWLYWKVVRFNAWKYRTLYGIDIGKGTTISRTAKLDRGNNPKGVHIGDNVIITGGVLVLAHDACRNLKADVWIGNDSFIGFRAIIMPGVKIGSEVIIGSGSVVTKDIPSNSIAVGNPCRVIKSNIHCEKGRIVL